MKKLFLTVVAVLVLTSYSLAVETETITQGVISNGPYEIVEYKQIVQTSNANNEVQCIDARGWDMLYYHATETGTIDYDIEGWLTSEGEDGANNSGDDLDKTNSSSAVGGLVPTAPFYCYDIDACTGCTLTVTWYLTRTVNK